MKSCSASGRPAGAGAVCWAMVRLLCRSVRAPHNDSAVDRPSQCRSVASRRYLGRMMDGIDRHIVALLRENARRSFQDIGARVALTAPAVKRRVDRLEADGVLRGYAAVVEPSAMGWPTHAVVALYCEGRMAASEVRAAIAGHPEVSAAFTVAGEASAILHVHARDTAHLERTLERIRDTPGIMRTQTQVVLSTLLERPVSGAGPDPAAGSGSGSDSG